VRHEALKARIRNKFSGPAFGHGGMCSEQKFKGYIHEAKESLGKSAPNVRYNLQQRYPNVAESLRKPKILKQAALGQLRRTPTD
jgi:hypothetical protein